MKYSRVMIFSAAFGSGHIRTAEALMEIFQTDYPTVQVLHLDCGEILNKTVNKILKALYLSLLKYAPGLWGGFYKNTSEIDQDSYFQHLLNTTGRNNCIQCIDSFRPDLIVCTYPIIAGILGQLRLEKRLDIPVAVVITDYTVHSQWLHSGVDLYIVGCQEIKRGLISRGIDADKIRATGIPVSPKFDIRLNRTEIAEKLGLSSDRPTILIMGGAYGVLSEIKEICRLVSEIPIISQTIIVCGNDAELFNSLDDLVGSSRNPVLRLGYARNVEELMTVADLIISKAGGLTVAEALTKRLPTLIFKLIPGQETVNARFLEKIGAGRIVHSNDDLQAMICDLLQHPEKMEMMRKCAAAAIPGRSAELACRNMMELLGVSVTEKETG